MWQSRVDTNKMLSEAVKFMSSKPRVICASGISFYAESSCDEPKSEEDPQGDGYLTSLNIAIEDAARSISDEAIILRFGVVLSRDGGALQKLFFEQKFC